MSLKKVNNWLEFEGSASKWAVNMSLSVCFYVHMHCLVAATAVFAEVHELTLLFTGGVC